MATIDTPWQAAALGGTQSYALALGQGDVILPPPKTVFLLRMVNGWYGWNRGATPALFGRDPRGISGGRYTGQQGAFLQQVAHNTYSNGADHMDTMRWEPLTGVPQTNRPDGWFVAYSDGGYTRYTGTNVTTGIFAPGPSDLTTTQPYHLHASHLVFGGGVTGTYDIVLEVPVDMADIIDPMKDTYVDPAINQARFNALASGEKLLLGFNDFPYPEFANEFDINTVNTNGYDGSLVTIPNNITRPYDFGYATVPGGGSATDCSFYLFEFRGIQPGVLMALSEVAVNVPYILVDWLQMFNSATGAITYTYLTAAEHPTPPGGKVIIPLPDMTRFPELAGSLFRLNWLSSPNPNGIIRHLIPGHTIDSWMAAGQPF